MMSSALKRKLDKYLEANTNEIRRANSVTNHNRKPSQKKRAVIDDYNNTSSTIDYISAIEAKQKNLNFMITDYPSIIIQISLTHWKIKNQII